MIFDAGKAWPHPVLRPPSYGDDYPSAEFEVEIEVKCVQHGTEVEFNVNFELSEPDLLRLVEDGAAHYVLLIKAPKTHVRECIQSDNPRVEHMYSAGTLSGKVEILPFLICTRDISDFAARGWHPDFDGRTFNIATGSVLAEDEPKHYWLDTTGEGPIGSIFELSPRSKHPNGYWEYILENDRVWIVMSIEDAERLKSARAQLSNRGEVYNLMNGLYLPALLAVLTEADQHEEDFEEYRWFASLNQRLEEVGCNPIGSEGANRVVDAQKILDFPFTKMPLIAQAENSNE